MEVPPTYEQLQQRVLQLEQESLQAKRFAKTNSTLFNISNAINTTSSLDELYKKIHLSLSSIIDTTNFYIALYDKVQDLVTFSYVVDSVDSHYPPVTRMGKDSSLTAEVIRSGVPLMVTKSDMLSQLKRSGLKPPGGTPSEIWLGVPLRRLGETVGVMAVQNYSDPHCYDRADMKVMVAVADQVALAIECKQAEQALQESEVRFHKLLQEIPSVAVQSYTMDGTTLFWNLGSERLYGYSAQEAIGRSLLETIIPQEMRAAVQQDMQKMADTGISIPASELSLMRKDGSRVTVFSSHAIVKVQGRDPELFCIDIDLSQSKQVEEEKKQLVTQLQQAQKMEAIGNLAGGIAHDFNNILSSILGFTELALEGAQPGSAQLSDLEEVYTAGNRARELVQQILAFARQSKKEIKPVRLKDIVSESLKLLRPSTPTTIEIVASIDSTASVIGNPSQLHQVVMNLCTNAIYSLQKSGGILEICLRNIHLTEDFKPQKGGLPAGEYIELAVADNGQGIDPVIIENIFEPYFTTKEIGEGTGMGLAMVKGIIESYGGDITVHSESAAKTTFVVRLPVTTGKDMDVVECVDALAPGTERILFVDDEPPISRMGGRMLSGLGYNVSLRTSSFEALELFKKKPDAFDLVITDMTMPFMTGDELAQELRKIRADIPIILCTGYSKKLDEVAAKQIGIDDIVYKPFTTPDLAKAVRRVLDTAIVNGDV